MNDEKNYSLFSVTDFVCDEKFQNWVLNADEKSNLFWQKWLAENEGKRKDVEIAMKFLQSISFKEHFPSEERVLELLYQNPVMRSVDVLTTKKWWQKSWMKVAAAIVGFMMLLVGSYTYWQSTMHVKIATNYGELKTIYLPDSSRVVLNAHSQIVYSKAWHKGLKREVWIKGEAFFEVRHLNKNNKKVKPEEQFVVHAQHLNIEVLGTSFDVNSDDEKTKIVLQKGSVQLSFLQKNNRTLLMQPGDLVEYDSRSKKLLKKKVDIAPQIAWKDGEMILHNVSLEEIADKLSKFYGLDVEWKNPTIKSREMEGVLYLDNLQNALFAISVTLNVHIEQKGNTLIFE